MNKTIYSLVTKPINQNVGIIRISGPNAFESIKRILPNFIPKPNKVEYQKLVNKDGYIDDALVLSFIKPNSFTGEDVIEIQSHGSMFVIEKIISELNQTGIEQSEPGEFMKQAYMNGKLDLSQTEAINTLILSENRKLTEKSLDNLNGKQSAYIEEALTKIGEIVSRIQVSIDYPENTDLPKYNLNVICESIKELKDDLVKIINDSQRLVNYSKGIKIALVGIPNAGKSTLLNNLVNDDRAIVSNIEGTTRDVIESITYIDGLKVTLQDTAGIRNGTIDLIEKEGIRRSKKTINDANIVILLLDGTKELNFQRELFKEVYEKYNFKLIEVLTKSDIIKHKKTLNISNKKETLIPLLNKIKEFVKFNIYDDDKDNNSLLISQSQIDNFNFIKHSLSNAINFIQYGETADVVLFELENSMKLLGKIIGKEIDQNYLTNLFANFCIGK
ncbi:MAG: tRNA modification GTPase MnmE [Candidatus Tyloplasma litorale]|nr:MAG: tRNA modification GTPase MnmE [Mycoplasmatales bacterium]